MSLNSLPASAPSALVGTEILAENVADGGNQRLLETILRQGVFPPRTAFEDLQVSGWISPVESFDEPWTSAIPRGQHSFFGLVQGQCQLDPGDHAPVRALRAGDFAIAKDSSARVCFDPIETSVSSDDSQAPGNLHASPVVGAQIVSGGFVALDSASASLLAAFPPVFVVPANQGRFESWIDHLVGLLLDESAVDRSITSDVVNRLLGILVIRAMRYALEAFQPGSERLSNAWADPEIGSALVRMHERLDHPWTVAGLAKEVGVCRSTFAARFLLAVGKPPLKYLRDLRMQRASVLLRERARSLKEIAALTGFRTRSSFCVAFRRWSGKSPREYRCFRGGAS